MENAVTLLLANKSKFKKNSLHKLRDIVMKYTLVEVRWDKRVFFAFYRWKMPDFLLSPTRLYCCLVLIPSKFWSTSGGAGGRFIWAGVLLWWCMQYIVYCYCYCYVQVCQLILAASQNRFRGNFFSISLARASEDLESQSSQIVRTKLLTNVFHLKT